MFYSFVMNFARSIRGDSSSWFLALVPFKPISGCSKIVRSSPPQNAPRRRSSATPHERAFEDGGEMAVFQQPPSTTYL